MKEQSLQVKSETDDVYTIGGYGVVWGGQDLEGDHFDQDTDLWLDKISETPPLLYRHGLDEQAQKAIVGRVVKTVTDEIGLWVEAQIEKGREFSEGILDLVKQGKLGLSSAAIAHLVEIAKDGKILQWPIAEISLTPTPMEPRTLGVTALRSLAELEPAIKSLIPTEPLIELDVCDGKRIIRIRS